MPTATQTKQAYLGELYERTAKQATNSLANWTGFLTTVGNLYKYPFHEQLMIYAQRPDATACAEYGLWNDTMNRYVHLSKGLTSLLAILRREKVRWWKSLITAYAVRGLLYPRGKLLSLQLCFALLL